MAITPYSGAFPDRLSAGDNEAYATDVYNYLNYIDGAFTTTVNSTEANINAKEVSVTDKEAIVVAKEALMSPHYTAIDAVYANATNINSVATTIVPNITEILQADTNAAIATTKAAEALASADAAAISEINAHDSELAAAAIYDAFDDRELGSKTTPPTTDNDGNPLQEGAQYWNSVAKKKFLWDGSSWVDQTVIPADHGSLAGLTDDDHTQYHNDTRGDTRYYTKSANDTLLNAKQDTLVSGTNIKTINGDSILGAGDIAINPIGSSYQAFTTSGTWTKPSGVTWIYVEAIGGGGGGCSMTGTTSAGGGGGGGYAAKILLASTVGSTETVTIGAAGAGGTAGNSTSATNGGNSSFGTHVIGKGGYRGGPTTGGATNRYGEAGCGEQSSSASNVPAGGGFGSGAGGYGNAATTGIGGSCVNGGAGGGGTGITSNVGGISQYGGNGGNGALNTIAESGSSYGGGGGACGASGTGGNGASGIIKVWAW